MPIPKMSLKECVLEIIVNLITMMSKWIVIQRQERYSDQTKLIDQTIGIIICT